MNFINNISKETFQTIEITIPKCLFNITTIDNINIVSKFVKNLTQNIQIIINLKKDIIASGIDNNYMYSILYLYLSLVNNTYNISEFIDKHIIIENNKILYKLYRGEIYNMLTEYSQLNNNIILYNDTYNISILNSLVYSSKNNPIYITFICNSDITINKDSVLCKSMLNNVN